MNLAAVSKKLLQTIVGAVAIAVLFDISFPDVQRQGLAAQSKGGSQESPSQSTGVRTDKLAEGEYAIVESSNNGAVGPFGEQIYDFHESWTMYRAAEGYSVEGVRTYKSPAWESHSDNFSLTLSRDLTMLRAQEFTKLKWIPNSGPISCDFLSDELNCSSAGSDSKHALRIQTKHEHPYALLWPVSPFSLSGLTRQVERDPARPSVVELLDIQQPSRISPVMPVILSGNLQYCGTETIRVANRDWTALKFSLKAALHPEFIVWTSRRGLLLALAVQHSHEHWEQEGLKLVRFHSFTDLEF